MSKSNHHISFRQPGDRRRFYWTFFTCLVLALLASYGLMTYNNPVPISSPAFMAVVKRRLVALVAMLIASVCQSLATIAFQSLATNQLITPSLLGFEALYACLNTGIVFFLGVDALLSFTGPFALLIQIILMVAFSLLIYGWLLTSQNQDIQWLLLIGLVLGSGLRALATFMRRLLEPSVFDVLQAKLMASVNNANAEDFKLAIPLVLIVVVIFFVLARRLNVISLGPAVAINLGLNYRAYTVFFLVLVSILMAISTALVGPLTFFGFLTATLTYQLAKTYDHRYLFALSMVLGFLILTAAYFFMNHIFNTQGVVSIIIELFGGLAFIVMMLRKGD
ncbi:iron ABC transporter permease [Aerococcus urinaehominis]|uniref:Iron ABC transporter permease n=1 Tax=Aerococcus urinaehominis TaxID=128944 RepID=A0A0X8FJX8_9LACT|nr:iron chelate uptake ABC transporter family permease subunit [Aerococcus urinaehominis]AMB98669.1 iron ABC transporter permease [Aerococcus urinaehominis]SDL97938.1 iron complex transport system permease protein [Aerococcus urinaehominis]